MSDFGQYGNAESHKRYSIKTLPTSRKRCGCGCKTRATNLGMANGVALMMGCELRVARWVRDGYTKHYFNQEPRP